MKSNSRSVGCAFSKETFAGTRGNDGVAPIAVTQFGTTIALNLTASLSLIEA
jgi:hypothetical protein